ncbi:MAG: NAD-dependent epimerase/dehydratase family protein [Myxococcaceae bacterium]
MRHLVLGSGPVGLATAVALQARGESVRLVSRRRPAALPPGVEHLALDVLDATAMATVRDVDVVHQCLNAAYHRWATDFPPLQAAAVALIRRLGARLVSFENLYPYGAPRAEAFRETDAFAPCSEKGRVRTAMIEALQREPGLQVAHVRASDLFGPGMHGSALGGEVIGRACDGLAPRLLGDPDALHTWTYVADAGETMARVALAPSPWGKAWHVPSAPACSQHEIVARLGRLLGRELRASVTPALVLRLVGLVRPEAGALVEMLYEFRAPFVMADEVTRAQLGQAHTPLDAALAATVASFTPRRTPAPSSTATPAPR